MKYGVGRHNLLVDGKEVVVEPGQEIACDEYLIKGAMDKFDCLDPPPPPPTPTVGLIAKHFGGGRWAVVNETSGARINDDWLSKEEAIAIAREQGPFVVDENEAVEAVNAEQG